MSEDKGQYGAIELHPKERQLIELMCGAEIWSDHFLARAARLARGSGYPY